MLSTGVSPAYRFVAALMAVAAIAGWGAYFFLSAQSATTAEAHARELRQLRSERQRLETALQDHRSKSGELAAVEQKAATAQATFARAAEGERQAKTALAAAETELAARRDELAALALQLTAARDKVDQTASTVEPVARPIQKRNRWASRKKRR